MGICAIPLERALPVEKRATAYSFKFFDKAALATEAKSIGALIRKRRVAAGMTQAGLAVLLGVSPWSVNEWESGRYRPRKHKRQVADWLGVSVTGLFVVMPNRSRHG